MAPRMADALPVIQATLAPAFIISGAGIFLNFTQARLFRVSDRLREVDRGTSTTPRDVLERRARVLRDAIAGGVLTIALTVMTAILLMLGVMLRRPHLTATAPFIFAFAMVALFGALCFVLYDTVLSVRVATHVREGRARGPGAPPRP